MKQTNDTEKVDLIALVIDEQNVFLLIASGLWASFDMERLFPNFLEIGEWKVLRNGARRFQIR